MDSTSSMISFKKIAIILSVLTIIMFVYSYFLNSKYYKYIQFRNYVGIITAVSTFVLAIGVLFQVVFYTVEQQKDEVMSFTSFSKDYVDSIIDTFMQHPEMNYYYDELFNGKINNHAKRNIVLENQISTRIFAKTIEQIYTVNTNEYASDVMVLKQTLIKIMNMFFRSEKFKNYYLYYYKPYLADSLMISFMKEHFGL